MQLSEITIETAQNAMTAFAGRARGKAVCLPASLIMKMRMITDFTAKKTSAGAFGKAAHACLQDARMHTRCKGSWMSKRPRLGARMCQGIFFLMAAAAMLCSLSLASPMKTYAAGWLSMSSDTTAEAAIVMDVDTGAVLWGKNINSQYTPASITKLMTGLIVLEKCSLDDEVTVAAEAVNNLESGASSVGLGAGDVLTVDELLHAMLLRSANDAANALACHVSGSIEAFAAEMTRRAEELGCQGTIFRNPSGLTSPENVTTAYDMALIGAECARTPGFIEVESRLSYKVSKDSKYPDGFTVNQEHKMLLKGTAYSDSRVIGGKTGFIRASGNTLVTIAEDNGMRLVAVVLKDKNPDHYKDTEKLLNFGFDNFETAIIEDPINTYEVVKRLEADKIIDGISADFVADSEVRITIPKGAATEDVKVSYDYNISDEAPENAIARMIFSFDGVKVGSTYIIDERVSDLAVVETFEEEKESLFTNVSPVKIIIAGVVCVILIAAATFVFINAARAKTAREQRAKRLERRRRRLKELDLSEQEFMDMVREDRRHKARRYVRHGE